MKVLVVGATGATGSNVVKQLLERGCEVTAVVRSPDKLTSKIDDLSKLTLIEKPILNIVIPDLVPLIKDCDAIISCLGHNLSLKGIYGKPRRLVRDSIFNLCHAIKESDPSNKVKMILMNTTGNRNKDIKEKRSFGEHLVIGIVRALLPPQLDNEQAAEVLRAHIGHEDEHIDWVVVRPDSLINEDMVSKYTLHPSPTRSPIFNAGKTSRINVAHFMCELVYNESLWEEWKGQMPVIYNIEKQDA